MTAYQSTATVLNIPPVHPSLKRVDQITGLGVNFNSTLSCGPHLSHIITKAAETLYTSKTFKCHGLNGQTLWDVA